MHWLMSQFSKRVIIFYSCYSKCIIWPLRLLVFVFHVHISVYFCQRCSASWFKMKIIPFGEERQESDDFPDIMSKGGNITPSPLVSTSPPLSLLKIVLIVLQYVAWPQSTLLTGEQCPMLIKSMVCVSWSSVWHRCVHRSISPQALFAKNKALARICYSSK